MEAAKRNLSGLLVLILVVPLFGMAWQAGMEARDDRRFPPPGRLVDGDHHALQHGRTSPEQRVKQRTEPPGCLAAS